MNRDEAIRAKALEIAVAIWGESEPHGVAGESEETDPIIMEYLPLARKIERYILTGK
jgi:hypothetical protein